MLTASLIAVFISEQNLRQVGLI